MFGCGSLVGVLPKSGPQCDPGQPYQRKHIQNLGFHSWCCQILHCEYVNVIISIINTNYVNLNINCYKGTSLGVASMKVFV